MKKIIDKLVLWLFTTGIVSLVTLNSFFSRTRMSHENGMVIKGRLRVVDDLKIPPSSFFEPGREFPCRLRHASVSFADDARLVVRSASIKFSDSDQDSPLDIMMNTGTAGPFAHASDFLKFMWATMRGRETHIKPYLDANPGLSAGITKSVCYPDTFALLNYHSKTALSYEDSTGKHWYIKFKLSPWDRGPDRGRPSDEELDEFWLQAARPGETRSRNFLKDEFHHRIAKGAVQYHLQAQFHEVVEGEDREILNCGVAWDDATHPWMALAEVEISEIMPMDEANMTWYDLRNHPQCISVPRANSIRDPASINHLRMYDNWAKRARTLGYKYFGQLPPLVDDRSEHSSKLQKIGLPQDEPEERREMRADEIISQQQIYVFATGTGQPPYAKYLPKAEEFKTAKSRRMIKDLALGIVNGLVSRVETLANKRKDLSVFDRYYPLWTEPSVSRRFGSDLEFGRQRLNGVNPVLIKRCDEIPPKLPVTDAMVAGLLDESETLGSAAKGGRLYLLDHESIGGIDTKNGYLAVPVSLFYCNKLGQLLPLAIQLEQQPGPDAPIFTPNDAFWLWTTVKAYVQAADATYHEVASHLLRTHMVMETFIVACHRQLHQRLPFFQLLAPHFHATIAINHSARTVMLAPGGPIDKTLSLGANGSMKLMAREYAKWDFSLCDLPVDLANRGVDDPDALPGYFYRDDARLLWAAISRYVSGVVDYWYPNMKRVAGDEELQAWFAELADSKAGNVRGLPEGGSVKKRDNLKLVLTRIIFTCTAEHSSVNNGQYDMFGYPPNVPGAMYKPWPTSKADPLSEADFISRLPDHAKCNAQMEMVHLLSQPTRWMIGSFESPYFHGIPELWDHVKTFRHELEGISEAIEERNRGLEVPYTYLDPCQISESIAI
jgi:hypothetical protein